MSSPSTSRNYRRALNQLDDQLSIITGILNWTELRVRQLESPVDEKGGSRKSTPRMLMKSGSRVNVYVDTATHYLPEDSAKGPSENTKILPIFDECFSRSYGISWIHHVGPFGGNVAHWIELLKSRENYESWRGKMVCRLSEEMLQEKPDLISMQYTRQPFTGQTLLMQAVANGDVECTARLLEQCTLEDVNVYATGTFMRACCSSEGVLHGFGFPGVSILESAIFASRDDDVALDIVQRLLAARADPEHCGDGEFTATIWHRLACSQYRSKDGGRTSLCSVELMTKVMHVMRWRSIRPPPINLRGGDGTVQRTPLQIAAEVGNTEFIAKYMEFNIEVPWQWGQQREVRLPIRGVDNSSRKYAQASVYELLVLYKHKDVLMMNLFIELTDRKWHKFGKKMSRIHLVTMVFTTMLLTLGCLEQDTIFGRFDIHRVRQEALIVLGIVMVICIWLYSYSRNCEWFSKLHIWGKPNIALGSDEVGCFRDFFLIVLGTVFLLLHEIEHYVRPRRTDIGGHDQVVHTGVMVLLDGCSSILVAVAWYSLLRFLQLFKSTCVLVTVLPAILKKDMIPWLIVYMILVIGMSGAIRIATMSTVREDDQVLGTFPKVIMTLEEATHGPDVQWRRFVYDSPAIAGTLFLVFLWLITIIMMNLLISIFSSTFDKRLANCRAELYYRRAVDCITYEKLMPVWFHEWMDYQVGRPRGAIQDFGKHGFPGRSDSELVQDIEADEAPDRGEGEEPDEEDPLLQERDEGEDEAEEIWMTITEFGGNKWSDVGDMSM